MSETSKPVLQKLGVKEHSKVAVLGLKDTSFMLGVPFHSCLREDCHYDFIVVQTDAPENLRTVRHLKRRLGPKGALWIVYPKGLKTITQLQVMFAGNAEGFTDCKVCSFSETHTALKFVRRRTEAR